MKQLDVSVVIAVKNEEIYIEETLLSIYKQKGLNYEIIIVDDGSSDKTFSIVQKFCENKTNIMLYQNPKSGKCSAFNYGITLSKGRFVCIFAGDDIMPEDSLSARFMMVKNTNDNEPVVGLSKLITLSEDKKHNGILIPKTPGIGCYSGVSPMMNRMVLQIIFPVPEFLPNEDTWMELAISYINGIKVIHSDIIGCNWRIHRNNSVDIFAGFSIYNDKLTKRFKAFSLFYDMHHTKINELEQKKLLAKIGCEEARSSGNVLGVIMSKVGLIEKLRSLSSTNASFYYVRVKFYRLFSGW